MSAHFTNRDSTLFIPSVELTGTREAKVLQLDTVLARLNGIRRTLAGGAPRPDTRRPLARSSDLHEPSARAWWLAGVVLVALFSLLTIFARVTDTSVDQSTLHAAAVALETY